jgi:iron complex outermembrane receptor protein
MPWISRRARVVTVGVSLLTLATPVLAQKDPAPPAPPPGALEAGAIQAGDIIVTAQRRSERLRDVPISITAVNSETLSKAGVVSTMDLARVSVGVEFPVYGSFVRPSIRGIVTGLSSLGDSPNVAIYLDGVYQPSASGVLADLPDVQSVQILKGPQGTLYGQNAAGGAIIIDTITPAFKTKGFFSASYGNYNDKALRGYVTGPLSSSLAGALSAAWEDRSGFNKDLLRGGHDKGLRSVIVRGKLLWQASASTSFTLAAYYSNRKDSGIAGANPLNGNSMGNSIRAAYPGLAFATKPHTFAENLEPTTNIKGWGVSLLGKIGLGDIGTLNTVSAYQKNKVFDLTDIDASPINIGTSDPLPIKSHAFIQELNFASNKLGRFTINAGLFFMARTESYEGQLFNLYFGGVPWPIEPVPGRRIGTYSRHKKQSYAAYLEASYDITDTVTVTAAGRYSYERQKAFNSEWPDRTRYPDPRGYFAFKKFTPRAVLRWKPDNNNTLYFSYSQGFKSGLVDNGSIHACYDPTTGKAEQLICDPVTGTPVVPHQAAPLKKPLKPESITAYEIGYKARVAETLNFSIAAFHYDYKNIQVFIYNPVAGQGGSQNAAKGRIDGVEFEGNWRATPELTLGLGLSYLKTKYVKFPNAEAYVPYHVQFGPGVCANIPSQYGVSGPGTGTAPCGNFHTTVNAKGNRLVHAPKFTMNWSIDYEHEFSSGKFGLNLNGNYDAGYFFDPNNRIKQKPYALLNAELSFAPNFVRGMRVVLWGKNLTNHDYLQSVLQTDYADSVSWSPPRQYGGRVEFRF